MTVEQRCNEVIDYWTAHRAPDLIETWNWDEKDLARVRSRWMEDLGLSEDEQRTVIGLVGDMIDTVDNIILSASATECLTSSSEYIRERKKIQLNEGR